MTHSASATGKFQRLVCHEPDELVRLRDEIRLKVHLAGMEAQSTWKDLEKQLEMLENRLGLEGNHVAETTRQIASELRESFRDFKQSIL
jgi:hypothetical protein